MAGIKPTFITGAKAIVRVYGKALAFCSDVSYNVNVQHIPVEALGIFEIISNEPVSYNVDGTFSVIRYAKVEGQVNPLQNFANALNEGDIPSNTASGIVDESGNSLKQHIDPAQIINSTTFDMEVMEKNGTDGGTEVDNQTFFKITDCRITRRGSSLNKRGLLVDNYAFVGILASDLSTSDNDDGVANSQ